jgi:hypothetical protein
MARRGSEERDPIPDGITGLGFGGHYTSMPSYNISSSALVRHSEFCFAGTLSFWPANVGSSSSPRNGFFARFGGWNADGRGRSCTREFTMGGRYCHTLRRRQDRFAGNFRNAISYDGTVSSSICRAFAGDLTCNVLQEVNLGSMPTTSLRMVATPQYNSQVVHTYLATDAVPEFSISDHIHVFAK